MKKTHINITIDSEIYAFAKVKEINVSRVVNELLKDYLNVKETSTPEQELEKEIDNLHILIENSQKKMSIVSAQLISARQKRLKDEEEQEERDQAVYQAVKIANPNRYPSR